MAPGAKFKLSDVERRVTIQPPTDAQPDPSRSPPSVPAPVPPADEAAWYAPETVDQYEVRPGTVATVRESRRDEAPFTYEVREPARTARDIDALDRVTKHFAEARPVRPRTREGTAERVAAGLGEKYAHILDQLLDLPPAARRRVDYYAHRDLRCLGSVTPLALDDSIEVGDPTGETLVVHTQDFAPAATTFGANVEHLDRVLAQRLERRTVRFRSFEVPVVLYHERLIGTDAFDTKYAVLEPDVLPGDEELIAGCKERIWEANVDGDIDDEGAFVRERAEAYLARQLTARDTRAWLGALRHRVREALAAHGLVVPEVDDRYAAARLDDLVYYVMRDYVGDGELTIPIRDPELEDIEANRVGERIKVVPRHPEAGGRVPTNLRIDDEARFTNLVTQLAARDGVELNAATPSAKVNLAPPEVDDGETIRCAVALPVVSEDGPHVSIRKQSADPMTPIDLVDREALPTELVALLWLAYEHHGVVLFCGPTGVGKTTLMNAHMPFIRYDDRPVSIDEGSREVRLPQETGVSMTTRDHREAYKAVTMADLMTEANYLNPDVEVIAEINTPASFRTFGEALQTGHGLIGTSHAPDITAFVNRATEQGLPAYLLAEIDLLVFPRQVGADRFVGEVVTLVDPENAGPGTSQIDRPDATVYYEVVCRREPDGSYSYPVGEATDPAPTLFDRLAGRESRTNQDVEREFQRKHRYVRYLVKEEIADIGELFALLADLRNEEAATVERLSGE
jgi:type IV secretory pathway ATPase VirB11/archaellum biosynthesis ATPase